MRKSLLGILFSIASAAASSTSYAATLEGIEGKVLVNRGDGYVAALGSESVATGDSIMVSPGATARIAYADGCQIALRPGAVVTIGQGSPCGAQRMGATKSGSSIPDDHYLLGGLLVAGGVAGAIILISDDDNDKSKPASP